MRTDVNEILQYSILSIKCIYEQKRQITCSTLVQGLSVEWEDLTQVRWVESKIMSIPLLSSLITGVQEEIFIEALQGTEAGASSRQSQLYLYPGGGNAFWEEVQIYKIV